MFKRLKVFCIVLFVALAGLVPANLSGILASEKVNIVDDNVMNGLHYFTYYGGEDNNGLKGWSNDPAHTYPAGSKEELISQHWMWNNDGTASNFSYTFTFVGTGVELVGLPNDKENTFQMDGETAQTLAIKGDGETILYSRKDLVYGEHVVTVTLPANKEYTGLQVSYANVYGTKDDIEEMMTTKILPSKVDGTINYFDYQAYSGKSWSFGDSEAYIDMGASNDRAEECYYEIPFVGNSIEIFANKANNHGKVKYMVDGEQEQTVNLYNASRTTPQSVYKVENLTEGSHVLRAVTMREKDPSSRTIVNQVAYANVKHTPYAITDIILDSESYMLAEGATQQIKYTFEPDYAMSKDITFKSDDTNIASVSNKGVITAEGAGVTNITVISEKYNIEKVIQIEVKPSTPGLSGSIVDTNTQYTQDRYQEVTSLGLISKSLSVWKNDKAISEIAIASIDSALKNVKVEASDFVNKDAIISADNINSTFIKSTKAYNGSYLGYASTTRPVPEETETNRSESNDILYQDASIPMNIAYNTVQNVWVEMKIPNDTLAGTYTGTLKISADGIDTPLEFTYILNVHNAELKDASEFKNSFGIDQWQYPYSSAEYYGVEPFSEEHLTLLRSNMLKYKELGGTSITATISEDAWTGQTYSANDVHYPSMVKWTLNSDDTFTYDFTDFDKWVTFNKELGIADQIMVYSIAPWTNSFTYWKDDKLVKEGFTVGSSRYKQVWTDFLQRFVEHLTDKGWFDDVYVAIDERGLTATALDTVEAVKNIHGKSLKTAGSMDNLAAHHDLALRITDLNIGDTSATSNPALYMQLLKERKALGLRTTLYSCTEHNPGNFSLSAPVESYWVVANAGKMEADGFNRWAYDAWVKDPLNDATHNAFEPGDTFLIYPDEKDAENPTSKSSVRLENIAAGIRDINKLRMIESEIPGLKSDIDAVYANINGVVATSRNYLTKERIKQLSDQVDSFKADLAALSDRYAILKENGTDIVDSITIKEGSSLEMKLGSSKQLHAQLMPANLLNTNVSWTSESAIVSVDQNGVVTANKLGTGTIVATSKQDPTKSASITITVSNTAVDDGAKAAYYNFDDATANDSWGTRNGVLHNASFEKGKAGKALTINTVDENVTFDETAPIQDTWTVGYWIYNSSNVQDRISPFMSKDGKYSFDLRISASNGKAGVHVGKNSGDILTFNYTAPLNEWVQMTWTQDKVNGLTLYVNGIKVQTNAWTKTNAFPCPLDQFGATGFTGMLDEIKVYNRVLNDQEIASMMMVPGLNLNVTNKALYVGETFQIETNLISSEADKTITYTSTNPAVASVDDDGTVTALKRGMASIIVENKAGGFKEDVSIQVSKKLNISNKLSQYQLPEKNLSDIDSDRGGPRQYLGQPDMVMMNDNQTLITAYPIGHGKGPLVMKISHDGGETWEEKKDLPASWAGSQETPTLYHLNLADGTERVMLITACPGWGTDSDGNATGWNTSYSDDAGVTWTEYEHWYTNLPNGKPNKSIVGMASLVQLKDENGDFIQKWMGVYHDYDYVNYKTYLTFDENGNEQWTAPVPYLNEYRAIESSYQMCEIGMFRSPDGKRIVGLARSQSHNNPATLIYSDDEGETWSAPMDLPGSLAGERHKAVYDPVSGRLVIVFREINYDLNGNNNYDGNNDWLAGDWIAWVGTYEDLMDQNEGQYRILLAEDWANNAKSGDTGYTGIVVQPDGTFIMDTYGHWDKDFSLSWTGGVTTDLCYIKQAKFKLGLMDNIAGIIDRSNLEKAIEEAQKVENDGYTEASWKNFTDALENAKRIIDDTSSAQQLIDSAQELLIKAQSDLVKGDVSIMKEILASAIYKVEKENLDALAPSVATMIRVRLAEAKLVFDDPNSTNEACMRAWLNLADVMHYLDFVADKADLEKLIIECEAIDTSMYNEGVEAFKKALEDAQAVYVDESKLQDSIDAAYKALEKARDNLIMNTVDKALLQQLYTMIQTQIGDGSAYNQTDTSWSDFIQAMAVAKDVLDRNDVNQSDINSAFTALTNVYENIRLLPNEALLADLQNFINLVEKANLSRLSADQITFINEVKTKALDMVMNPEHIKAGEMAQIQKDMKKVLALLDGNDVETPDPVKPGDVLTPEDTKTKAPSVIQGNSNHGTTKTGDATNTALLSGMLLIGGTVLITLKRKKK